MTSRSVQLIRYALAAFATAALCACASTPRVESAPVTGERVVVETSPNWPPEWITREPESDAVFHYFRGIRSDAPSLEGGETDARHNAMSHIVQFLGLRIEVDYERLRTEEQTQIRDAIRSVGGADIFGTRLSELAYRRSRINDGGRVRDSYDVGVLIRFPRESVERIKQNQRERLRSIQELMAGPSFMARPDEIYPQIDGAARALEAIGELSRNVLITTETENDAFALRQQAVTRLTRLVGSIQIAIDTGTDRIVSGSQHEPFVITVRATAGNGAASPVPNAPVAITVGDSLRTVWTNADGVAVWEMRSVPLRRGTAEITGRLDLPDAVRGLPGVARNVPVASTSVEVVPLTALTTLLVVLEDPYQGCATRTAEARLAEALKERGFRVVSIPADTAYSLAQDPWTSEAVALALAERSGATVLVRGNINTDTATPVQMMPGIFFTRAEVRLSLLSVRNGETIGTVVLPDDTLRDTRGFGNTAERAIDEALKLDRSGQVNGYAHIATQIERALMR